MISQDLTTRRSINTNARYGLAFGTPHGGGQYRHLPDACCRWASRGWQSMMPMFIDCAPLAAALIAAATAELLRDAGRVPFMVVNRTISYGKQQDGIPSAKCCQE